MQSSVVSSIAFVQTQCFGKVARFKSLVQTPATALPCGESPVGSKTDTQTLLLIRDA